MKYAGWFASAFLLSMAVSFGLWLGVWGCWVLVGRLA